MFGELSGSRLDVNLGIWIRLTLDWATYAPPLARISARSAGVYHTSTGLQTHLIPLYLPRAVQDIEEEGWRARTMFQSQQNTLQTARGDNDM